MPKSYLPEFRRHAVRFVALAGDPGQVARGLGVSEATIYRGIAQDEVDLGERPGIRSDEQAELSKARERIRELDAALELTRKASALFNEGAERPAPKATLPGDRLPGGGRDTARRSAAGALVWLRRGSFTTKASRRPCWSYEPSS